MNKNQTSKAQPVVHKHIIRTLIASLLGTIATLLVIISILVVWANRTLIDTSTYVSTVAPLAANSQIQSYVVSQITDQITKNVQPTQLAQALLPNVNPASESPAQLLSSVKTALNGAVSQVITKPAFEQLWVSTNRSIHQSLINQLNANSPTLVFNLQPTIKTLISDLSQTSLGSYANQISLPANAGHIVLRSSAIVSIHKGYKAFIAATWLIVALTIVLIGLTFVISVHHLKTLRRIGIASGVVCLIFGLALSVPSILAGSLTSANSSEKASLQIAKVLVSRLQLSFLIIGGALIILAIVSKIVSHLHSPKA